MKTLSHFELTQVSGGETGQLVATTLGALLGSYVLGNVASALGPLNTVITTTGGVIGCGIVGNLFVPVVGGLVGAAGCGVGGYYLGSAFVTAASYGFGALLGGGGMYMLSA